MAKSSASVSQENVASSSSLLSQGEVAMPPRAEKCVLGFFSIASDYKVERPSSKLGCGEPMTQYISSITDVGRVKADCRWGDAVLVEIPSWEEDITTYKASFLIMYTYPFTLGPVGPSSPPIDPVILEFYQGYQVTLGQIYPSFWRIVYMIRYYVNMIGEMPFTFDHLIRMYKPRFFHGSLIKLRCRASRALFACIEEPGNGGWISRFVRVRTSDLIPTEKMLFPERWNVERAAIYPSAVTDLPSWVGRLDSICPHVELVWRDLSQARWEDKDHDSDGSGTFRGGALMHQ
uniref:Uncharacterized protein LOC104232880 isoform X2 n=1 Tax=Nicotiana sylvestris TaxID=4096 RepID=A0A1U7XC00_NICSY|nr:PREDICTED: uncharacterized protein LOC104232880 isoform X2 [Nicotiana sylvestris]